MKCPDHYAVLGVSDTATEKEIRAAYRALAFQHHPDVSSEQSASTRARFQHIQEAYHALRHRERRATYDRRHKWFHDAGFHRRDSAAEREQEERLRAEMAASWALDKEDAQRVKAGRGARTLKIWARS